MILLREKTFAKLQGISKLYRNNLDFPIRKGLNNLKKEAKRKTIRQVKEGSVMAGRKFDRGIVQPGAVLADVTKSVASRPLKSIGTAFVVVPAPTTAAGAGLIAASNGLMKVPKIAKVSQDIERKIANSKFYKNAQASTRGFHNGFGLFQKKKAVAIA